MLELLSVADAARITGFSEWTIREAVRDGELVASKVRRRILIQQHDLAAWIDAGRIQPATDTPKPTTAPRPTVPTGGFRQAARQMRAA